MPDGEESPAAGRARPQRARPLRARREPVRVEAPTLLACLGITVRFGGLNALNGVDLHVREGEIVGLIGPNGAGKTTLMECISGFRAVVEGRIEYRGTDLLHSGVLGRAPSERAALGIGRTLQ